MYKKVFSGDISKVCRRKEHISINALLFNGETYTDSAAKANILNNQFLSVFTKDDHSILPIMRGNPIPDIEHLSIGVNKVYNCNYSPVYTPSSISLITTCMQKQCTGHTRFFYSSYTLQELYYIILN